MKGCPDFRDARLGPSSHTYMPDSVHNRSSQSLPCGVPAGLRQATSTFGALMGASVAGLAFKLSGSNFVLTFALSAVPAFLALVLVTAVSPEP